MTKIRFTSRKLFATGVAAAASGVLALLLWGGAGEASGQTQLPPAFKVIPWEALMPTEWDPVKSYQQGNKGSMDDSDPYGRRLMRAIWDNAPTVAAMDGATVKLPGYVVPLEDAKGKLKEFLLVPYFGACIHSPPPPANQIIHVVVTQLDKAFRSMDTVWVSGRLKVARKESDMGMSGYSLQAARVESYAPLPRP